MYVPFIWEIVHWLVAEWKSNTAFSYISTPHYFLHDCIWYTQFRLLECLQREIAFHFTVTLSLPPPPPISTNSSAHVNTRVMWSVYFLTKYVNLNVHVKLLDFILLSYQRDTLKSNLAVLHIHVCRIPYTLSTYHRKDKKKTRSDNFLFTIDWIFLLGYTPNADNKKWYSQLFIR
jgi:hypothetical protein